jgi:hypothetical protein
MEKLICQLSSRHGAKAGRVDLGPEKQQRKLHAHELPMGNPQAAIQQSEKLPLHKIQRSDKKHFPMGKVHWNRAQNFSAEN